jgi:hypothetical protein
MNLGGLFFPELPFYRVTFPFIFMQSSTRHYMDVSGELHVPSALLPWVELSIAIEREAE